MSGLPGMASGMSNMSGMAGGGQHGSALLPGWLGAAAAAMFVAIAAAHLLHMSRTGGQRRPWHACHVLMALGMAFMYAPAWLDPGVVPAGFWRLTLAAAGVIAGAWALRGAPAPASAGAARVGDRAVNPTWLLTSLDLGAMLVMLSPGSATTALDWTVIAFLILDAGLWCLDLYRRIDGSVWLLQWLPAGEPARGGAAALSRQRTLTRVAVPGGSLLGELDISASMIAMTLGMAYMVVTTALAR